ncbi:MAG: hypothetical protein AB7K24_22625 [Gemmataceae bacterium]
MFFALLAQTLLGLIYFWPITIATAMVWWLSLAITFMVLARSGKHLRDLSIRSCFAPFAVPLAMACCSAMTSNVPAVAILLLKVLLLSQLPLLLYLLVREPRLWPATAGATLFATWIRPIS